MATQTVRFTGRTGLTLTADVYDDTTAASFATGVTITESVGIYSFSLTDSAGTYRVCIKLSGAVIDTLFVKTANAAATFDCVIQSRDLLHASQSVLDEMYANVTAQLTEVIAEFPPNFAALGINSDGHVSRVTLVDTTTENTDMRGTDGANTTAPLSAAATSNAVWNALPADHEVNGSYGELVLIAQGSERAVSVDNNHRVHAAVYEMQANVIDGNSLASSAIVAMGSYQIPQTVPAVGTAPTRDQAIMMLAARGRNAAIVGTTETIYAADGTTPLYTLTLTNDGEYTTAIERAS